MNAQPSLALRLSMLLLAGQIFCFSATLIGNHIVDLIDNDNSAIAWNALAEVRTRHAVIASLSRAPDGSVVVAPNAALTALTSANPQLQFAVFDSDTGAPIPGSSPELVEAFRGHSSIWTEAMPLFRLRALMDGVLSGAYRWNDTPVGGFMIATHGYRFRWFDLFYHLYTDIVGLLRENAFTIVSSVLIGSFTLHRGLAPLEAAVARARTIDMSSLDQRIPLRGVPQEIAPLIATVNAALDRLRDGVAQRERFLANAAHELRTPLTIMNVRLANPQRPGLIEEIKTDVRRLRNVSEQLLGSARLRRAEERPADDIDLARLVGKLVDEFAQVAVRSGKSIEMRADVDAAWIKGDERALESVIGNVIDNAIRAEPKEGAVIVYLKRGPTIEISDHGDGVPEPDREAIFEPFWRKRVEEPGSGLGLAIAREIIELHEGTIRVDETPGGGATFVLAFARYEMRPQAEHERTSTNG